MEKQAKPYRISISDATKLQKNDVEGNIQLTPTSALKENKMSYSMRTK